MTMVLRTICQLLLSGCLLASVLSSIAQPQDPLPAEYFANKILLNLPNSGTDEEKINFEKLPVIKGLHAIINPTDAVLKFQLHNYLIYYDGKYWCMWSQGPPVEDEPSQHVRYATSEDGLKWSEPRVLVGPPKEGYAYIARGFWVRNGQLIALFASFKGKGAFGVGKELQLQALVWNNIVGEWEPYGLILDNAINNFPPEQLPTGKWLMMRRDSRFKVSALIGGQKRLDDWQSFPVANRSRVKGGFCPDEPIWWMQNDKSLTAVFRDNGGSRRLFRAVSIDEGRTWSSPVATNFPNATSKIFSLRTSTGYRVLISNANPNVGRRQLYLSVSEDGLIFTQMALLDIPSARPATLQYPHAIEHDGYLVVTFSRNKSQSEIVKIPLQEIAELLQKRPKQLKK